MQINNYELLLPHGGKELTIAEKTRNFEEAKNAGAKLLAMMI
jgi:hypothetical protein